ncbi:MAG: hypothetical protein Q7V15_05910, partial [Phenylobacterium sp.]|uniref:hypothetical protein n=1 Tax=Phenylobacterium sp. TaxID=1871053 RepID=UPI0027190268
GSQRLGRRFSQKGGGSIVWDRNLEFHDPGDLHRPNLPTQHRGLPLVMVVDRIAAEEIDAEKLSNRS